MIVFVIGGSGSGKSAYAEKRLLAMEAEKKHYIATMRVFDEEGKKRVEKASNHAQGKGLSYHRKADRLRRDCFGCGGCLDAGMCLQSSGK